MINFKNTDYSISEYEFDRLGLDEVSKNAILSIAKGKNTIIHGPGGTGKSWLIKKFIPFNNRASTTGISAKSISGKTIHRMLNLGTCKTTPEKICRSISKNSYSLKLILKLKLIVIDEFSMLSAKKFQIIYKVLTILFGKKGLKIPQLVLIGDVFQLSPVPDEVKSKEDRPPWYDDGRDIWLCKGFYKLFRPENIFNLVKNYRQTDPKYKSVCNSVRKGLLTPEINEILQSRIIDATLIDSLNCSWLLPTKIEVNRINNSKLDSLDSEKMIFTGKFNLLKETLSMNGTVISEDVVKNKKIYDNYKKHFLKRLICDEITKLAVGARVISIVNQKTNYDSYPRYVNGSQGVVIGFDNKLPIVKFNNDPAHYTIDYHTWTDTEIISSNKIIHMEYTQIPLLPAWALTIHKSQGMTLNRCVTSTNHIFESGQFYVAISRVKTLDGLFLTAYNPNKIKVNKRIHTDTFK